VESYVPGHNLVLVPRYPTSVFYNTTTPEMLQDEYNYIFYERYWEMGVNPCTVPPAICWPRNYAQILEAEADTTLRHILSYKTWPHFFHQANLHNYDGAGSTLQFDWLNAVVNRYEELMTLPLRDRTFYQIGKQIQRRLDAANANVVAQLDQATDTVTIVADDDARVMITGLAETGKYGGQRVGQLKVKDEPKTYEVDRRLTR
jgi:hypothetical protein